MPVANVNYLKPSMVLERLKEKGYIKTMSWHTDMWRKYKVRPASNATNKSSCKSEYCVYDRPHKDYLYTDAWVQKLVEKELSKQ